MLEPDVAQIYEPLGETNRDENSPVRLLVLGLIAGGAYYVGALIGFALTFPDDAVSTLWPPNAILLAGLLLTPTRRWCAILLGVFPAHFAVQLQTDVPIPLILSWFMSNSAEALIGAFCVRYFIHGPLKFDSFHHVGIFTTFAVIFSPFVTSFLDAGFVVLNQWRQVDFWEVWKMRFPANVLAALTLVPAIVLWIRNGVASLRRASLLRSIEGGALILGLLSVASLVFTWQSSGPSALPALVYMPLPFLLWAAVRFGPLGSSTCVLILVLLSIWETVHGRGPFISSSPEQNVFFLQLFLIAVSLPLFFLAALLEERRRAEQTRAQAAAILESSNDAIIGCTFDAVITTWNRGAEKLYGYPSEEAVGQPVTMLIPSHRGDVVTQIVEKIKRGEGIQSFEGIRITKSGRSIDVSITVSPVIDTSGKMVGLSSIARDITERKRAEEALRESEKRLARTEKFSLVMVTHTDLEGRWLKVPPTLCELLGYTEQELLGRRFNEVTYPDDIDLNLSQRLRLLRGEIKSFDLEKRYLRKNGGIVWVYINVSVVTDATGTPVHCLSYIRDISRRKQAEDALRESEERLQLALEAGGMGAWDWDKRNNLLQWSSEHFTIMGLAPFSVTPTCETWVERVHPDDVPTARAAMERAIAEGTHYRCEYRVVLPDDRIRWVVSRGEPIYNDRRQCVRVMGTIVDITERKRAESRLNAQYQLTRVLSESGSLGDAAPCLIQIICECFDWQFGEVWRVNPESNLLTYLEAYQSVSADLANFVSASRQFTFACGVGLPGRVWKSRRPAWISDLAVDINFLRRSLAAKAGLRSAFGFPILLGDETFGVLVFFSRETRDPDEDLLQMMASIGSQIGQFIERQQALDAVGESEVRNRAILESALDSIITIDHRGVIVEFNPAAEKTFGYKRADAVGKQMANLIIPPALRDNHYRGLARYIAAGEGPILDKRLELMAMRADGTEIPIELAISRIGIGGPPMFTGYIRDITQRRQAEEEIHRLKERLEAENVYLRSEVSGVHRYGEMTGESEGIKKVLEQVERVAPTDMTVLILGETGTGKELVARLVHEKSRRRERPLVKVNCSALPAELIESELFGHERGAFTGAVSKQVGRFELADGGTIFLDEVGELPLRLQSKLLRVLQEGEFERLGSGKTIKVDVRVIAATNRNLSEAAQRGRYRADLYYRLNVYPIEIPPLRERGGDIGLLAEVFLHEVGRRLGKRFAKIPNEMIEALRAYSWPGNVRELDNVIGRAAVISTAPTLQLPDGWNKAPVNGMSFNASKIVPGTVMVHGESPESVPTLEQFERTRILEVLHQTNWRIEGPKGAALILGLHPNTLRSRMNKLAIMRPAKASILA